MLLAEPFTRVTKFPVEVRSAGDKGLGVFATRNVKRNEYVCWYDGVRCANSSIAALTTGAFGYSEHGHRELPQLFAGFRTMLRPGGCAQLCNDAATDYTDGDLAYLKHINVAMLFFADGDGVVFYATKPIKRGDELLFSYGAEYWQIRRVRALFGSQQVLTQGIKKNARPPAGPIRFRSQGCARGLPCPATHHRGPLGGFMKVSA